MGKLEWPMSHTSHGRWSPLKLRAIVTIFSCLCLAGLMVLRSTSPQHNHRCSSIMDVLDREPELSKFAQALDVAGLAEYFDDQQLEATMLAPTDDAVSKAAWEDWSKDNIHRLLGHLLYHSVPLKMDLSTMPREVSTDLGPNEILLMRAGGDAGRLKKPTTAVVAPLTDSYSPPARVLRSVETCQGIVHVIDTVLEPDESSVEPVAVEAALIKMAGQRNNWEAESAGNTQQSRARGDLGGIMGERGGNSRNHQKESSSLDGALKVANLAVDKRAAEEAEAERKAAEAEEHARNEEAMAELAELSTPGGAANAVMEAEVAQNKALSAARLAFREAEASGASLAAARAQDWLGAAEYAVEGITSAKEAGSWSGSSSDLTVQARSAAHAAMLLAEVSLAQHTAVAMARTGDWAASLLGGEANPVLGTEAGKAWADAALDAHSKALKAASAAGALASSVAAKAQAQGVLGSKAAKQPADEATLDAIRNLAQKLPPAERSSLNSLLASALKSGGTSEEEAARNEERRVKRILKPEGSWPAAGQNRLSIQAQQDDISAEEQEQLEQDIAELSGANSGSEFDDAKPEMQPSRKAAAAKLQIRAARKSSGFDDGAAAELQELEAEQDVEDSYLDETANQPYEPDAFDDSDDQMDLQEDLENKTEEEEEEMERFVNEAVATKLRSQGGDARNRGIVAKEAAESQSEPRIVSEDDGFFAETQTSNAQSGTDNRASKRVTLRRVDPQSSADALEPYEGEEAGQDDIYADEATGKFDTADRLMARKQAAERDAAGRRGGAGGSADAKSGEDGARQLPDLASSRAAAGNNPRRANGKHSEFARTATGVRDSNGNGGSEGGVLLDTWEEKQKEVE
ncbi:hypothetical protein COCOBI_14-0790 [Coccomyxa sp. Obi]|nr:hypothetical protein COCOBI_14-0790 [Coccomyxa sp. Obi]